MIGRLSTDRILYLQMASDLNRKSLKKEELLLVFWCGELRLVGGEADLTILIMAPLFPGERSWTLLLLCEEEWGCLWLATAVL